MGAHLPQATLREVRDGPRILSCEVIVEGRAIALIPVAGATLPSAVVDIEEIVRQRVADQMHAVIRNGRRDRVVMRHCHDRPIDGEAIVSFDRKGRRIPRDPTNPQR